MTKITRSPGFSVSAVNQLQPFVSQQTAVTGTKGRHGHPTSPPVWPVGAKGQARSPQLMGLESMIKDACHENKIKVLAPAASFLVPIWKSKNCWARSLVVGFQEHICVEAKGPAIVLQALTTVFFETGSFIEPRVHSLRQAGSSKDPGDRPVSTSPKLGLEVCSINSQVSSDAQTRVLMLAGQALTKSSRQPQYLRFSQFCFPSKYILCRIPSTHCFQVSQKQFSESLFEEQSSVCTGNQKIHFLKTSSSRLTFKTGAKRRNTKFTIPPIFKYSLWN